MQTTFLRWQQMVISCVVLITLTQRAGAEPPRAAGASTGDGSTAFTGLAQAPEANLFVGAATTSIPIEVPPGRKSVTPSLALTYNSGGGSGPYGYGWDLPLGRIQRTTKHGVLECSGSPYANDFVLVLPGASVECTLDTGTNRCVPRVEESFLRIQFVPSENRWEVWDKSGLHYLLGSNQASRAPINPTCYTSAWGLNHLEDPNGNSLEVVYSPDVDANGHVMDNGVLYPDYIVYGGTARGDQHHFEINFVWSNEDGFSRPPGDQIVNGMGGFAQRLTRLLSRIEVRYTGTPARLVRSYQLQYDFQTDTPNRIGRQSFLSAVTLLDESGHALSRADGLPASTTFLHQQNDPASGRFQFGQPQLTGALAIDAPQLARRTIKSGNFNDTDREIMDMNGDGLPDLIDTSSGCADAQSWNVYLGTPRGFSSEPVPWSVPAAAACTVLRQTQQLNHDGDSATLVDTLDLNGDSVPDYVDARTTPWKVYFGHAPASDTSGWFDATPTLWPAPLLNLRMSYGNVSLDAPAQRGHWDHGSSDRQDLLDLNGDGLLDLVQTPALGNGGWWTVWLNTGSGFGPATPFNSTGPLRYMTEEHTQLLGVFDINGDGLVDQIFGLPGSWIVYLNTGHEMVWSETWAAPDLCGHTGLRDNTDHANSRDVARDLFDINGDGLPDLVTACAGDTSWHVRLNRGDAFSSQDYRWTSPFDRIRHLGDDSSGAVGGTTYKDVFDLDGDGMVDLVDFEFDRIYHNAAGMWAPACDQSVCFLPPYSGVALNPDGGRPDLLVEMENGIGSSTHLVYRPSTVWDNTDSRGVPSLPFAMWTLTHIDQDDGMCDDSGTACLSGGSHMVSTDLTYAYGLYVAAAHEFRGFGTVQQKDAAGTVRTSWFHQDAALRGKVSSSNINTSDPSHLAFQITLNDWECADQATQVTEGCPDVLTASDHLWIRLADATRYDATEGGHPAYAHYTSTATLAWDAYGNATHSEASGNGVRVDTYTTYAYRDDAASYNVDKPAHVWVLDNNVTPLEEKWFAYDTSGNLTLVSTWLDQVIDPSLPVGGGCPQTPQAGIGTCVGTQMAYDILGNITQVVDANGNTTTTTYDTPTRIYPYTVKNASNQEVATGYDPGCGKMLWQTVPYPSGQLASAARAQNSYDSFCRLIATALPDETLVQPHRSYAYFLGAPRLPTDIETHEAVGGSASPIARRMVRNELYDALGRRLQAQRDAVVDGHRTRIADATAIFDVRGNVTSRYAPFQVKRRGAYTAPPAGSGATSMVYDALNRVTQVTNPDGSFRTTDYGIAWQATSRDECQTAGTCQGGMLVEAHDAFGRTILKQVYDGNTFVTETRYTYDGLGRLRRSAQGTTPNLSNGSTIINHTHDSLGRKIQTTDPDSGAWRYGYDLVGNVIYQDDPKSDQHIELCYDALNRITDKFYRNGDTLGARPCGAARGDVAYTYDQDSGTGLGRLTGVIDPSGATGFYYDVRGRTVSVLTSLTPPGGTTTLSQTSYTYDTADHVLSMTYPDGEVVQYLYDPVGQVKRVKGAAYYVRSMTYDILGRPRVIKHGNGTIDTRTYAAAAESFHLKAVQTRKGATTLLSYTYDSYLPTGLLQQLTDIGPMGNSHSLDNSAVFTYDGLGRLTGVSGANLPFANAYAYDGLGNMTRKEGMTLTYDSNRPHTLQQINGSSTAIAHDANGNRTGKPGATYGYNADDRLTAINGGAVQFVYDYTGRRVAKIAGSSVTRYYGSVAEATDGSLTKYYYAAGMLVASQQVADTRLSGLPPDPAVQVAGDLSGHALRLVVGLRPDVQPGVALLMLCGGLGLLVLPGRRKPVVGIPIRRGPVLLLVVIFAVVSLPVPIIVRPAAALQLGTIMHYHPDHLGSTQLATDTHGRAVEYIRYNPYGEVRGHYDATGAPLALGGASCGASCREFTGYDSEPVSGLQYAGARFYDPTLGMFLTHDPVREFANPYCYVAWNPVNGTDPTGAIWGLDDLLVAVIIGAIAGATASGVQALVNGAPPLQALKAAGIGGALGGATAYVGATIVVPALNNIVVPVVAQQLVNAGVAQATAQSVATIAVNGTLLSASVAQAGYGVSRGDYSGVIGIGLSTGLVAGLNGIDGSSATTSAKQQPGDASLSELDLRQGDQLATADGSLARGIGALDPTGDFGHTQTVLERQDGTLAVLTSDAQGQRVAGIGDSALSGRGYVVFRPRVEPTVGTEAGGGGIWGWVNAHATSGGLGQYVSNWGGNICSATSNTALYAGGIGTGFAPYSFVTPNQLVSSPALVRVGRLPYVP